MEDYNPHHPPAEVVHRKIQTLILNRLKIGERYPADEIANTLVYSHGYHSPSGEDILYAYTANGRQEFHVFVGNGELKYLGTDLDQLVKEYLEKNKAN